MKILVDAFVKITETDTDILYHSGHFHPVDVAECMPWATRRTMYKLNARASSLTRLFNVSMSLIYGEGEKQHSPGCESIS